MKVLSIVTFSLFALQWLTWWLLVPFTILQNSVLVDSFSVEFAPWRNREATTSIGRGQRELKYSENGITLEKEEECIHHFSSASSLLSSLKDVLAEQPDGSSQLIRVACAFAPSPHNNMHPKQILSATIVHVDSTELQVALAIPQESMDMGTCVQVLVPIPISCDNENGNILPCILQSLERMDVQANQLIGEREMLQDRVEQMAQQEAIRKELQEENVDSLPDWWTFAELKITLAEECDALKVLLNDYEFAPTLRKLCQIHSTKSDPAVTQIWEARVASVGPSGVFLKAYATVGQGDESRCQIVDVPIRFSQTGSTADDVREYVLDLVESVETFSEQALSSSDDATTAAVAAATTIPSEEPKADIDKISEENIDEKLRAITKARKQPKSPEEEAILAGRYAAITNLSERAFCILKDLGMI